MFQDIIDLYKAKSHKYTHKKRVYIKGKPAWRYFYKEHHGKGATHVDDLKEGEAFKVNYEGNEGHFHIDKVDGDNITVIHDETKEKKTLTKRELRAVLQSTHGEALRANVKKKEKRYKRAKKELESARKQAGITEESNFKAVPKEARKDLSNALLKGDQQKINMLENKIDFDGMGIKNPRHYKFITGLMSKTTDESNREIGHVKKTFKTNDPKMIKEALKTLNFKHFFGSSVYEHNANYQNLRIEIKDKKELEFTFDNFIQVNASSQKDLPAPMDTDAGDRANEAVNNQPPQAQAKKLIDELSALLKANPDLANDPRVAGLLGTAKKEKPKREGKEATVFIYGATPPEEQQVKYRLIEAGDAIASHDPASFSINPKYPRGVQERAYHTDKHGQFKVMHQAQNFKAEYMINTNPDAVNGAPIVMEDGTVLGGNSRTMSLQRVYADHPDKAEHYKKTLKENAQAFGFTEEDVQALKAPMLVRVYEPEQKDTKSLQVLSRALNENKTAMMDARLLGRSQASRLKEKTLKTIADSIEEGQTLNHFLSRPSKALGHVVQNLLDDGILTQLNSVQYMKKDGSFNGVGKDYIENLLIGSVIRDINILEDLNYDTYQNLAVAVGQLAGAGLGDAQKSALQDAVAIYNSGIKSGFLKMRQQTAKDRMNAMRNIMEKQQNIEYEVGKGEVDYNKIKRDIKKNPLSNAFLYILTASTSTKKVRENIKAFIKHTQEDDNVGFSFFASDPLSFEDSAMKVVEDIQRTDTSGLSGAGGLFKSVRKGVTLYSF